MTNYKLNSKSLNNNYDNNSVFKFSFADFIFKIQGG